MIAGVILLTLSLILFVFNGRQEEVLPTSFHSARCLSLGNFCPGQAEPRAIDTNLSIRDCDDALKRVHPGSKICQICQKKLRKG